MGTDKRQRQKEGRQARIAAAEVAKRKADQRRRYITLAASVLIIVALGFALSRILNRSTTRVATGTTTSTLASAAPSAAGKPCVAVSDPLPAGAPAVDVKVGPPPTALVKTDLKPGTGPTIAPGETVTVNYIGVSCSTGKIFDSTYKTGKPAPISLPLTGVIKGWTDGIPGMKVGGQRLLGIPSSQAYGSSPPSAVIAPDEALWFVVEVTAVGPAATTTTAAPAPSTPPST